MLTAALWGSSFSVIKVVVSEVGSFTYTWVRSTIAILGLSPYVAYAARRGRLTREAALGGLMTGLAYALGLWLQGWGTGLTSASNSAFITGLNVVFVHAYSALTAKEYRLSLATSLALSVAGLYLLTAPGAGFNVGDLLILLGAFMWAAQVLLVARYSRCDPGVFTFFEMAPALAFAIPDLIMAGTGRGGPRAFSPLALLLLAYLALACSDLAFALQVLGQRHLSPAAAAIVLLLEPVFAAFFAYLALGEAMGTLQALGASLILAAMASACLSEASRAEDRHI